MRAPLLSFLLSFSLSAVAADLSITMERTGFVSYSRVVSNLGSDTATDVRVRIMASPALPWNVASGFAGWQCLPSTASLDCTRETLGPGEQSAYSFYLPGTHESGRYGVVAEVSAAGQDSNPNDNRVVRLLTLGRAWQIQTTIDAGAGSLREAIEEANRFCTESDIPCSIGFYYHPEMLPQVIALRTPLPPITACNLAIVAPQPPPGFPQQSWTISGRGVDGEGLLFAPRCDGSHITVEGVAVTGFGRDAIAAVGPARAIVDVRRVAASGESRGIAVDAPNADVSVSDSIVSGTGRSAVTLWAARTSVLSNVVLRNSGASGLFLGPNAGSVLVRHSGISGHRHFGIAAHNLFALENTTIFNNVVMDIDHGLDGPTDVAPLIRSATYDPARNVTIIAVEPRGSGRIEVWASPRLTMFATAHLQEPVGGADAAHGVVTIEVPRDLRGRFVSALRVEGMRVSEPGPAAAVR